jgi:homoaconitate hydratase
MALAASRGCRQLRLARAVPSALRPTAHRLRTAAYSTTPVRRQNAFHAQLEGVGSSAMPSPVETPSQPQTLTEKIIQRYSVGLAPGKKVKAGDYVTLKPEVCLPRGLPLM